MIMPFIAVAHVLWLLWVLAGNRPMIAIEWLPAVWMLAYTVSWIATCDLRRWGAVAYILLSVLNLTLYLSIKNINIRYLYVSSLFGIDVLFSCYLLYSFKKFSD